MQLSAEAEEFLARAADYLENPSFLIRLANLAGQPLESFTRLVPQPVYGAVEAALARLLDLAVRDIPEPQEQAEGSLEQAEAASGRRGSWYRLAAGATGFTGGLFGLPGLAVELPVSTAILFRSIASIAADYGEDLTRPEGRLECLTVFSYSGTGKRQESFESSYLTTRLALSLLLGQSSRFLAGRSAGEVAELLARGAAPVLVRLLAAVTSRFQVTVAQKLVAQALPLLGAAGGAAVNVAFTDHFNQVARYHFGIRKLERLHGAEVVQAAYREKVRQLRSES